MSAGTEHTFRVDWLGRPLTTNAAHRMHFRKVARIRKDWRGAAAWAVNLQGGAARGMGRITVECWGSYPNARALPDPEALAPSLKGFLDGLVDAAVIPDDTGAYVASVTFLPPVVDRAALRPALNVRIRSAGVSEGEAPA